MNAGVAMFEAILVMLLGAVALLALARRVGAPYPTLMAVAGAALALLPVETSFRLDPSLALALFVAPVLLDAAYDTSIRDLKANWRPVLGLVLVAVGLTTAAVACLARLLVPDLPWAAAVTLGAIVAPPDAAAAIGVLRQINLPHRLGVILEGESLLNDASALLIYRLAVTAAVAGTGVGVEAIAPAFLLSVVGSLIAGPLLAMGWTRIIERADDPPSATILQFVGTFGIWVAAERLHLSPILTVVSFAMTTARRAPRRTPARLRVPAYAVWDTAVVLLTVVAFVVIGLQLRPIIAGATAAELHDWLLFAAATLAVVIVMRLLWVMVQKGLAIAAGRSRGDALGWGGALMVGWCGMRGIVTVATALALPTDFPHRDLLLFTAFFVTLGTLLLQGLTLRPLVRLLALHDDGPVEREVRLARVALAEAALGALDEGDDDLQRRALREELERERAGADAADDGDGRVPLPGKRLRADTLALRRERLLALREDGTIGDDAFHRLEEELDYADLAVASHV